MSVIGVPDREERKNETKAVIYKSNNWEYSNTDERNQIKIQVLQQPKEQIQL